MNKSIHILNNTTNAAKTLLAVALVCFVLIFISCGCYLFATHSQLSAWFTGLNTCFYDSQAWSTTFFTPGIKSDGNMYSLLGMLMAAAGTFLCTRQWKKKNAPRSLVITYNTRDVLPYLLCITATILLWRWGSTISMPGSDEVFSAQNVAGIHPFQAIAYYMLPNNHILFNFINNILFHPFANKVTTGRFISLLAYTGFILIVFHWLKNVLGHRWLALLSALTLALQFQVWGFSFQARGYELYLLAQWGLLISLFQYLFTQKEKWLWLNAVCSAAGFFCIPSFLYLFLGQSVFFIIYKRKDTLFWKYQSLALAATYLLYLPALCFSGLESLAQNNYVSSMNAFRHGSNIAFAQWMFPNFKPCIDHIFSGLQWNNIPISTILFLLPLLLLLNRKNKAFFAFGLFYATMWLTFFLVAIVMKKLPFERNLIAHYSITLAALLLLLWWLTGLLAATGKTNAIKWILFPGVLLLFSIHFLRTNKLMLKDALYEYDVNTYYKEKTVWLSFIPAGSTVAVSDQDFYSGYICRHMGYKVSKCPAGTEKYYIKEAFETIPKPITGKYVLAKKYYGNEIWKLESLTP